MSLIFVSKNLDGNLNTSEFVSPGPDSLIKKSSLTAGDVLKKMFSLQINSVVSHYSALQVF